MKSQLIFCILVTFLVGLLHAESNENDNSDPCYENWMNQSRLEKECIHDVFNETEFLSAVNSTLLDYSGDDEAVRVQTKKFCPILSTVIECTLIGFDLGEDCEISPEGIAHQRQSYDLARTMLNFLCANNSEVLLQILPYKGLDTIYQNKKTKECLSLINGMQNVEEGTLRVPTEYCNGVDKIYACYADMVRDHKNINLVRLAGELNELHRQALKCAPEN